MNNQPYRNGAMPYHTYQEQEPTKWSLYADNIRMQERIAQMEGNIRGLRKELEGVPEMKASYARMKKAYWIVVSSALGLIVISMANKISISI